MNPAESLIYGKECREFPMSPDKNPLLYTKYTACWIGVLKMVHNNPHITGQYNPLNQTTNQGFFIAHMDAQESYNAPR